MHDLFGLKSAWPLVGLIGTGLFGSRWLVQVVHSRRAGRSVVPATFWALSTAGSLLLLTYFLFGPHRDAVGVLSNLFPLAISIYNLLLARRDANRPAPVGTLKRET